jgi:hypothetical protein
MTSFHKMMTSFGNKGFLSHIFTEEDIERCYRDTSRSYNSIAMPYKQPLSPISLREVALIALAADERINIAYLPRCLSREVEDLRDQWDGMHHNSTIKVDSLGQYLMYKAVYHNVIGNSGTAKASHAESESESICQSWHGESSAVL